MKLRRLFINFIVLTSLTVLTQQTFAFSQIYIFGDSLSDIGVQNNNVGSNAGQVPIGKDPTWTTTTGHIWPYYLAQDLGLSTPTPNNSDFDRSAGKNTFVTGLLDGNDYAAGGATTNGPGFEASKDYSPPSLLTQVSYYLNYSAPSGHADPDALYIIWAGANNMFSLLTKDAAASPQQQLQDLINCTQAAAKDILTAVTLLKRAGATHILYLNLPNLGITPLFSSLDPTQALQATQASVVFQLALQQYLTTQNLMTVDAFTLMTDLVNSVNNECTQDQQEAGECGYEYNDGLASYPLGNVISIACNDATSPLTKAIYCQSYVSNSESYMFADLVHPTGTIHHIIADKICLALRANGFTCNLPPPSN